MNEYSEFELLNSIDDCWQDVRDEGFRRQDCASKKIARLERAMEAAIAERASAQRIILAAEAAARKAA